MDDLMQNFNFPYFSRDIAEFWRRWHISLSTWFRDYLYIPLGGSKGGIAMKVRNTCIIFLVSGFWHGANWTFIAWGAINALLFLPLLIRNRNRTFTDTVAHGRILPSLKEVFQLSLTFVLVTLGWIFFRSDTISDALAYIARIVTQEFWVVPHTNLSGDFVIHVFAAVFFFVYIEWIGRGGKFALEKLGLYWSKLARRRLYILVCFFIFLFFGKDQAFIYFQF